MAYNLHIEHADGFWISETNRIPLESWLSYCDSDDSMEIVDKIEGMNPSTGQIISIEAKGTAYWTDPKTKSVYSFFFNGGRITFGGDDDQEVTKAKEIAKVLGGVVVGDEGEQY